MPITLGSGRSSRRGSSERAFQTFLDWCKRIMQLASVATILLYAYLLYGLFMGDVGHWATLSAAERSRIAMNVQGAVSYLNIAFGILLLTVCILYYDEEAFGYTLVIVGIVLYYGLPFLLSTAFGSMVSEWESSRNVAARSIMEQIKLAALLAAVPGGILVLRDLFLRVVEGSGRKREEFSAMQYGGAVKEEKPPAKPALGIMAKCWQLSFCRDAIRKGCPIYHARTRCWRQRVGCMCEENVIRHAMDAIIGKELIAFDAKKEDPTGLIDMTPVQEASIGATPDKPESDKTVEFPPKPVSSAPNRNVKIPHNPNIPMAVKRERCRNCVIYNEHQRLKYQFFAPVFVLIIPGFAFFKAEDLSTMLNHAFASADSIMARLSLAGGGQNTNTISKLGTFGFANYLLIGCLVVIGTTMSLRFLEYCIFKLKL